MIIKCGMCKGTGTICEVERHANERGYDGTTCPKCFGSGYTGQIDVRPVIREVLVIGGFLAMQELPSEEQVIFAENVILQMISSQKIVVKLKEIADHEDVHIALPHLWRGVPIPEKDWHKPSLSAPKPRVCDCGTTAMKTAKFCGSCGRELKYSVAA